MEQTIAKVKSIHTIWPHCLGLFFSCFFLSLPNDNWWGSKYCFPPNNIAGKFQLFVDFPSVWFHWGWTVAVNRLWDKMYCNNRAVGDCLFKYTLCYRSLHRHCICTYPRFSLSVSLTHTYICTHTHCASTCTDWASILFHKQEIINI